MRADHKAYAVELVKKTIHLIRDPFDNLVARMHYRTARQWTTRQRADALSIPYNTFENTPQGLRSWCETLDGWYPGDVLADIQSSRNVSVEIYKDLPCLTDWLRYVTWHNWATQVAKEWELPNLIIYYEDYSLSFNRTLERIMSFLELEIVQDPFPFVTGKTYHDLFRREIVQNATKLVRSLATEDCWELIQHYFSDFKKHSSLY